MSSVPVSYTHLGLPCQRLDKEAVIHRVQVHAAQDAAEIVMGVKTCPGSVSQLFLLRIPDSILFALYISHTYYQRELPFSGKITEVTVEGSEASDMGADISSIHPHAAATVYSFKADPDLPTSKILRNGDLCPVII